MKKIIYIILFFSILGQNAFAQHEKVTKKDLKKLYKMMAGEFSSELQSKQDTDFFHIKLRMKPCFKDRTDGYWFYVEQSTAKMQEKPYRQRIYHLFLQDDTTIVSKVYEMKNPQQYVKAWEMPEKLKDLTVESLIDRQGCGIFLRKKNKNHYGGATPEKQCLSTLRGATYATSEVDVFADKLISWDRGWSKEDKQVWGATKSGYIFVKARKLK
jgi:CpeT protein